MSDTAQRRVDGWRASYLAHQPVVNVQGGESLGEVVDLVFDPANARVAGLLIQSSGREGSMLELARRAFGGTLGLMYVDLEHVLALDADVVTVDLRDRGAAIFPRSPLPRLSAVLGFDVITIRGRRLGQLDDLLLGADGRVIVGYLVGPRRERRPNRTKVSTLELVATDQPEQTPDDSAETSSSRPSAAGPAGAPLLIVPSSEDVRVGRDLVVVAGSHGAARPDTTEHPHASSAPAVDEAIWQTYNPDAPTQQMTH